jgi:hypothetical protein
VCLLHESALQWCNFNYNLELNLLLIKGSQISSQTTKGSVDNARSNGWMCTVSIISTSVGGGGGGGGGGGVVADGLYVIML